MKEEQYNGTCPVLFSPTIFPVLRLRAAKSLKLCGRCKLQKLQDKSLFSLRIGKGKLSG